MLSLEEHTAADRAKLARRLATEGVQSISHVLYERYLRSKLWKSIRCWVIEAQSGKCGICDGNAQEVHHHDYNEETLWGKSATALVGLCTKCHGLIEFSEGGLKRDGLSEKRAVFEQLRQSHSSLDQEGFSLEVSRAKLVTSFVFAGKPEFLRFVNCATLAYSFVVSFEYDELSFPLPLHRTKLTQKTGVRLSARASGVHIGTVWADARSITVKRTKACTLPLEDRLLSFLEQSKFVHVAARSRVF